MMQWLLPHNRLFNAPAKRIVSLVPSLTEFLFDLGLDSEVVGITKFCVHPESWFRSKQRIGGTKNVHVEKLLALQPDLVIASKEENIKEQVEQIAEKVPVLLTDVQDYTGALKAMKVIAVACGKEEVGVSLCSQVEKQFALLPSANSKIRVAYCIWKDPWMFAGGDTYISGMLKKAGFENILHDHSRYPVLTLKQLAEKRPGIVFLSSEPYPFQDKHIRDLEAVMPGIPVLLVDGEMFSWYGSRLLQAPAYFAELQAVASQNRLKSPFNS
jgi:ABC-type Fe3+-hydroxamate transport system substrate-binding protein